MRIIARLGLVAALGAQSLGAQVVRGRVTEVNTAVPVPGALVSLLAETGDEALVSVLASTSGDYAVRAPVLGRYRLSVKRIGVRRYVSEAFDLGSGETRILDVSLDAVALSLPQVTVSGLCATRTSELSRISSLWDEARTALEAAEVSVRDELSQSRITKYAAELDPSLRVLFDWKSEGQVQSGEPYSSPSGDSLSAAGYWHTLPGDSVEFLAPDARALTSNAFLRDHCFQLAPRPRNRADLVGLAFQPARDRTLPDIMGTIWLDARRFELRFIEFRYTRLDGVPNAERVGGEVHYVRLESGAWLVDRWFIRMPQLVGVPEALSPRRQLREEGGTVVATGVVAAGPTASVSGIVRDSSGRPLADALVRAIGTHRETVTRADGSYRLDSLPPGGISVVVHTNGYDSYAVLAASRRVDLQPGRMQRLDLRAPNSAAMRNEVCLDPNVRYVQRARVRGALRLLMVDSATSVPMPGVRFLVTWPDRTDESLRNLPSRLRPLAQPGREQVRQALTDSRGTATFCDLPYGFNLEVSLPGPSGERFHVMMVDLKSSGITGKVVYGRINR